MKNSSLITIYLIVFLSFIHHACGSSDDYDNSSFLIETKNDFVPPFMVVGDSGTIVT